MAWKRLTLHDFVIVHTLDLDLSPGFTALTGETGAGKSILIDALQLVLGSRADASVVREGARRADISAEFDCPARLHTWLEDAGLERRKNLLLRRTVDTQGKSRGWINGSPVTATQLRFAGQQLLDIHGQHAWQSLTRSEAVRGLLDAYAGASDRGVAECWTEWRSAKNALLQAQAAQETRQHERERLQWRIAEIEKLAPVEYEWEELNAQHTRLTHAQALLDAAQSALFALDDDDTGAGKHLAHAQHILTEHAHLEPEFATLTDILASSVAQTNDAAHSLQTYLRRIDLDPQRLAALDSRVSLWLSLARRYKQAPGDLPALLSTWKDQLQELDRATDLVALEALENASAAAYEAAALTLSTTRTQAAPRLSAAITQAMQELGMAGGLFEASIQRATEPGMYGFDEIVFKVAGHAGMTPRPIARVASGGELSRISLAIAVATSALGTASTLIFDEVDAGVGGAVAETVGRLMKQLGHDRQVLAVTHLPQVAACADQHLVVSKNHTVHGMASTVTQVQGEQRVHEVARMLGGEKISAATLAHAHEMLGSTDSSILADE